MKWDVLDLTNYLPEAVFYLIYGILFHLYCEEKDYELELKAAPVLFVIDLFANVVELLLRVQTYAIAGKTLLSIFLIAVLRTASILFILWCLNYYKFGLLKREHAERYQRLLFLISKLNEEVVLMQKNRKLMEATMSTSYKLYQEMEKRNVHPELSQKALNIAKDVHELKKEYSLILRGLSDAMDLNTKEEGMYLNDIFRLLQHSLKSAVSVEKELELDFQYEENLYTEQHYFLISIFRNLVNNAIEASDKEVAHIEVRQRTIHEEYIFTVEDDGPGIPDEHMDQIFQPGFSTKINFETGEVSRGLGLELVKDLIEQQCGGTISVESRPRKTVFEIRIPTEKWKGEL
jgi:two-component system sensor histidine kinase YcbA